jgi:hypothetical protein
VAHDCNPSYSGSRDQEDHGLKPAWGKYFMRLYLEKTHHKKRAVEWLKWQSAGGPKFKSHYHKKNFF